MGTTSAGCELAKLPPFRDLPASVSKKLADISRLIRYRAGQTVAHDGEKTSFIGCVGEGVLRMQKTLPDGRQHIVGLLVEGDMFGRVLDGPLHFAIEAATDVSVCAFKRRPFEALLEQSPELERSVLLNILNELDRARHWMLILSQRKVSSRIAGFLLMLCTELDQAAAAVGPEHGAVDVTIPISRTDLAHLLGSRPESISRALHALADAGWIEMKTPYQIRILDIDALVAQSGEEDPISIEVLEELFRGDRKRTG